MGLIREYDGVLSTIGESFHVRTLYALDLAFAVFPGEAIQLAAEEEPVILSAYSEQKDMILLVLHVPPGKEQCCCRTADHLPLSQTKALVVLLLDEPEQKAWIHTKIPTLVAYPNGNGGLKIDKQREGET